MDFLKLIQSLDELLYEMVSWLLFYPVTLWRVIRSPVRTMQSAERELRETERKQFDDTIPPPLFLLLTLGLAHLIELGIFEKSYLELQNPEISRLVGSDFNLMASRIVMLSVLPLAAALRLVRARGSPLDRSALKAPFYAQCYAAALFTLLLTVSFLVTDRSHPFTDFRFLSIVSFALLWLYAIEGVWFAAQLQTSLARGLGQATILILQWLIILAGVLYVLG